MFSRVLATLLVTVIAVSASPVETLESRQSCASTYTVVSGDWCSAIEQKTAVSDATLHALNPSINSGCTNLQVGQVLCLSGSGSSSGGGSSGGSGINGIATYYQPDGGFGACGNHLQNTDAVVALGVNNWAAGAHCGRNILVQYQGRSITLSVQDLCPGCQGDNGIDLTEGAMAAIDPNYVNDGHINVVWSFV